MPDQLTHSYYLYIEVGRTRSGWAIKKQNKFCPIYIGKKFISVYIENFFLCV